LYIRKASLYATLNVSNCSMRSTLSCRGSMTEVCGTSSCCNILPSCWPTDLTRYNR
jgi:hypothetical protein